MLRFHIFTCRRQSQKMSLTFFSMVFGVIRDFRKRFLSSAGSWRRILTSATRQYVMTNAIPIRNGSTKLL